MPPKARNHVANIEAVRTFWDEHVCGDVFTHLTERNSQEYLAEVQQNRYHYEYHLLPFLQHVARAGHTVLEIGCGMGMDLAELAKLGCQVTGIDLSPQSLQVAQRYFTLLGLKAELRVSNAEAMDFGDAMFDVVYSFGVLHHTPDIKQALNEVYRVLRPGGRAFLMLYSRYALNNLVHVLFRIPYESPRNWQTDAPITCTFSKREVQHLLQDFVQVHINKAYLFGAGWRPLADIVPQWINSSLGRCLGWHWMIEAQKPE
jgi:ubiquinone/menaquinone biosynthesis C-methylase UbiE